MNLFNIDLSSDRTKAIIVILLFFFLALYNFYSIPADVLKKMKDRINARQKIYHDQNLFDQANDLANNNLNNQSVVSANARASASASASGSAMASPTTPLHTNINQRGGFSPYYIDRAEDNRMSPWDEVPNKYDPVRVRDKYNIENNPIVYQGFGIPLMSDLMCSSFAGLDKNVRNGNDRAIQAPLKQNTLGTIPSDKTSMFYFSDNISAPECCPGPYSTDQGCVCSFEKTSF